MPNMRPPRDPRVSGDTVGPNHPDTVRPNFDNPYRDKGGDVAGPGDFAGRKRPQQYPPYQYPGPFPV